MKDFLKSIKRTPYQTLTAFLVLFFTVFLSMSLLIALSFTYGLLNYLETRPQVTVYFQPKTTEDEIFKIKDELSQSGKVLSIKYISQKQAFEIYKQINKDNPLLLEMVESSIFPPSLEIYATKPIYLPEIAEYLKKQANIDEVQYQKDIVDKLLNLTNTLRKVGLIFFSYLILMSVLVMTTIILFKITLKKDEIEILRLLGASTSYIRAPYIKEGFFLSFFASVFSLTIILAIFFYLQPFIKTFTSGIGQLTLNLYFFKVLIWPINWIFFLGIFLLSFCFAFFITTLSSFIAVKKYLKI